MELKTPRRKKGETLHALLYDMKRLMSIASPGKQESLDAGSTVIDTSVESTRDLFTWKEVLLRGLQKL